jgi:hypothetical protein
MAWCSNTNGFVCFSFLINIFVNLDNSFQFHYQIKLKLVLVEIKKPRYAPSSSLFSQLAWWQQPFSYILFPSVGHVPHSSEAAQASSSFLPSSCAITRFPSFSFTNHRLFIELIFFLFISLEKFDFSKQLPMTSPLSHYLI